MSLTTEEIEKMKEESEKEMLDELAEMRYETVAPSTEIPDEVTEAPSTEAPEEDEEFETEAPPTEVPETEAPSTDAPEEDDILTKAKAAELDLLKEKEAREAATQAPSTTAPPTQAPTTMAPLEDMDFLEGMDLEDVTSDPKVLNKVLNKVLAKGVEIGRNSTTESVLRSIPNVMGNVVAQQLALKTSVDAFYKNNEDLVGFKKIVALTAEKLGSQNPDWTLEKLYEESGIETRKVLGLKERVASKKKTEKKPAFGRGTKGKGSKKSKKKEQLTDLQKEIKDMIDLTDN